MGVDDFDTYEFAKNFIEQISTKGEVKHFVVHARKALLKVLNFYNNILKMIILKCLNLLIKLLLKGIESSWK